MRGLPLAVCAFAAIFVSPLALWAQGLSLDSTPTPAGATPTPTPTAPLDLEVLDPIEPGDQTPTPTPTPSLLDATPTPGATPRPPAGFDPGLPGQWGYPGALRVVAASPGDPGVTQFAAGLEFFSEPGFIVKGKNHRRTVNTLAFDHAVSRSFAMSVVVLNTTNHSGATNPLYIAALGDLDVSGRFTLPLFESNAARFAAGARGGVKLMQGDGPGKGVGEAASPYGRVLATLDTATVRISADGGYFVDRSAALVPEDTEPDPGQLYAYGVSNYNAVLAGAAIDFPGWRVSPFAEITTRIDLGAEGEPATLATGGVKIASASRRASLLLGADYGLSGKKVVEGRLRAPTWNAIGGLSYSFGAGGPRPARPRTVKIVKTTDPPAAAETTGRLKGKVLAMSTRAGVPRATVTIEGYPPLVTDAAGAFEAQGIKVGAARIGVKADGYQERKGASAFVQQGQITSVILYLYAAPTPPSPSNVPEPVAATLKGKIISTKGKPLAATITASFGGKTKDVKTDAKGAYKLDLVEGDYSLTIKAPGMKTQTHTGKLGPLEAFELDFMLATDKKKAPAPKKPK